MSEAIALTSGGWTRERVDLVKKTVCPKGITDDEFALFMEQCKRSGLDPLLKEAFCVKRRQNIGNKERPQWIDKHEFQPAETGMLARAERFPDFGGISAAAVYSLDPMAEIDTGAGTVAHKFSPTKGRGKLLGAWARVVRGDKTPVVVWLEADGYQQPTPLWSKIPGTMIEKCARVAALRKAYPSAFGGLYIRDEMPAEEYPEPAGERDEPLPPGVVKVLPAVTASRVLEVKGQVRAQMEKAAKTSKMPRIVEVADGQTEEEATKKAATDKSPWARIVIMGKAHGLSLEQLGPVVRSATQKASRGTLTDADVELVRKALETTASPATVGEPPDDFAPPPHGDEDGPG